MDQWQREDLRRVHGSVAERGLEKGAWVSGGKLVVNDRGKEWVLVGLQLCTRIKLPMLAPRRSRNTVCYASWSTVHKG